MDAFRDVLQADPGNREAYTYLCNQYILLGTAYTAKRSEKSVYYNQAMMNCELAMYTNPLFRQEVDNGSRPWEAAQTLEAKDAPAVLFWVTALQYEFMEAMFLPSKKVNVRWMQYTLVFLDRVREVAPLYGNGAVELAYTVSYCVLPGFFTRSPETGTWPEGICCGLLNRMLRGTTTHCRGESIFSRMPHSSFPGRGNSAYRRSLSRLCISKQGHYTKANILLALRQILLVVNGVPQRLQK